MINYTFVIDYRIDNLYNNLTSLSVQMNINFIYIPLPYSDLDRYINERVVNNSKNVEDHELVIFLHTLTSNDALRYTRKLRDDSNYKNSKIYYKRDEYLVDNDNGKPYTEDQLIIKLKTTYREKLLKELLQ
jgi:hypothetical protein